MAGRPKKGEAERRENVLRIRLTEAERGALDKAAAGKALDVSAWARMTLLSAASDGSDVTAGPAVKLARRAKG